MSTAGDWSFTGMGTEFDTHVAAHLPGYADVQNLIALIATHTIPTGGLLADLGASTGTTAATVQAALPDRHVRAVLYDEDLTMLDQAGNRVTHGETIRADFDDTPHLSHTDADLTVALWLLQFLNPRSRRPLLTVAREAARPGSPIIVAAKTRFPDSRWETLAVAALTDYKAAAGVTAEEQAAKTRALRGRLTTQTVDEIRMDLTAAGWQSSEVLWKWHVWTVIGAWAP